MVIAPSKPDKNNGVETCVGSDQNIYDIIFASPFPDTNKKTSSGQAVRGISYIENIALLTLEGSGMIGIPGYSKKLLSVLAKETINVNRRGSTVAPPSEKTPDASKKNEQQANLPSEY